MVKRDGRCVMGRGVAAQAKEKFSTFPLTLGRKLEQYGNHVYWFPLYNLITFPVKHAWWEQADPELIKRSATELVTVAGILAKQKKFYLVRPGCGNGQLDWREVKPILAPLLDDRFTVVELGPSIVK